MTTYSVLKDIEDRFFEEWENESEPIWRNYSIPFGVDNRLPFVLAQKNIDGNVVRIIGDNINKEELMISIDVCPENEISKIIDTKWAFTSDPGAETKQTGTCGIKGLIWIFRQIPDIIEWAEKAKFQKIICCPTDKKRESAYKRLFKIGFGWDAFLEEYYLNL